MEELVKKLLVMIGIVLSITMFAQEKELIIRCDDLGMSNSVNMAFKELLKTGYPLSVSVMFNCPWYKEAVDILKANPDVSVGVHLTLNAEWKNYRWGPIVGKTGVASLVDEDGYFFPSRSKLFANNPKLNEIEIELRAQLDRAIKSGLKIDYLDFHMDAVIETPELRRLVEKLAKEYKLGISSKCGEVELNSIYDDRVESKTDSLVTIIDGIKEQGTYLLVCHIGLNNSELSSMEDLNPWGPKNMSESREGELKALLSKEFNESIKKNNLKLINYRSFIEKVGLENMKSLD